VELEVPPPSPFHETGGDDLNLKLDLQGFIEKIKGIGSKEEGAGRLDAVVASAIDDIYLNQIPQIIPDAVLDTSKLEINGEMYYVLWSGREGQEGYIRVPVSQIEKFLERFSFLGLCFSSDACFSRCFVLPQEADVMAHIEANAPYRKGEYEYSVAEVEYGGYRYAIATLLPDAVKFQYEKRLLNNFFISGGIVVQAVDRMFPIAHVAGVELDLGEADTCLVADFKQTQVGLYAVARIGGFDVPICSETVPLVSSSDHAENSEGVATHATLIAHELNRQYKLPVPQKCLVICPEQNYAEYADKIMECIEGVRKVFPNNVLYIQDDAVAIRGLLMEAGIDE
jgi:hypothetical protein